MGRGLLRATRGSHLAKPFVVSGNRAPNALSSSPRLVRAAVRQRRGFRPDRATAAAALQPARRTLGASARPHRHPHRAGGPAAGRDRRPARAGDRRARGRDGRRRLRPQRSRRHQEAAGAARTEARRRCASRDRCRQGGPRKTDRAGHGRREPGQTMRGGDRPRRPAAGKADQAARRAGAADPAPPRPVSALARRLAQDRTAVHGIGEVIDRCHGELEPRGLPHPELRQPAAGAARPVGRAHDRPVVGRARAAAPLRPGRNPHRRAARPGDHRRHRRARPRARPDPGGVADRQAAAGGQSAGADRRVDPRRRGAPHPAAAGVRHDRRGPVAGAPRMARPAVQRRQRPVPVAGAQAALLGQPAARIRLPCAQPRRGPRCGRLCRRRRADRRRGHAQPARPVEPRLARRPPRGFRIAPDDRRDLVGGDTPAAGRRRAVVDRLVADRLCDPGRAPAHGDLDDLPADRDRLPASQARGRPAGRGRRPGHALRHLRAQRLRPRPGQHAARPVPGAAAVRRRPGPAAGDRRSGGLERRHGRDARRAGPARAGREGGRRHHLARQCRHGDRRLLRVHAAGASRAQCRARPRDADRRGTVAVAPVDRCRPQLCRRHDRDPGGHRRAGRRFHQPGHRPRRAVGRHRPRTPKHRQQRDFRRHPAGGTADQGGRLGDC